MLIAPNGFQQVYDAVQSAVTLTAPQLTALQAEYDNDPAARGYAGQQASSVLELMCKPYSVPNPVQPQPLVERTDAITRGEFVKLLNKKQAGGIYVEYVANL